MVISFVSNHKRSSGLGWAASLCLVAALLAGCGREDIQVYRVAKEAPTPEGQGTGMPAGHPEMGAPNAGGAPSIKYTTPSGWEQAPLTEMRVASFRVVNNGKQAEISVVPLAGMMGHELQVVNNWRAALGLPAANEEDLAKLAETVQIGGEQGKLFDQAGENPGSGDKTRILAAMTRHEGVAWFFKMNGDDEVVAKQKPAFVDFLKSVSFVAGGGNAGEDQMAALPPSHPPIGDAGLLSSAGAAAPSASGEGRPGWQVPQGWQEVAPDQFLLAKYVISGPENAQAAVNVSRLSGTGGGVVANVNRWRRQLGLSQLSDADVAAQISPLEAQGGKASLVDLNGTDPRSGQKTRLIGIILPQADQTWFYKLMGSETLVEREKSAFLKFVQSAKYQ